MEEDVTEVNNPDPPLSLVGKIKKWFHEWKLAFAYTKNPLKYTKKHLAIDIVSSARSYTISGIPWLVLWFKASFPWFLPAAKAVWAKVVMAAVATFQVVSNAF